VKPACASGSKGCRIVRPQDDLAAALAAASAAGLTREVALEEVIEGHQGTCEGWFDGERITFHLLLDRQTVAPPFVATSGHRVPSILPEETERLLLAELERLFRLLGVARSIFDCDFIARPAAGTAGGAELFLLEATLRVGGNSIVRLVRHATGVDLAELAVRVALGEIPNVPAPASIRPTAIVLFGTDRAGRLGYDTAAAARLRREPWVAALEFDRALGDPVIPFTSGRAVVGRALIDAPDRTELDRRAQSLERDLALTAEPSE
jgi:biotin carboxylase